MLKFSTFSSVLLSVGTTISFSLSASATTLESSTINNATPLEIAVQAYIWGYPLISLRRTEALSLVSEAPINQFSYRSTLATPADTAVVRPNNDTLYASAFLDLSQNPLILDIPDTNDRYYSLQFLDAYTNTFAYVGTRENNITAGRYGIIGPNWQGTLPNDLTNTIQAPSNTVWLLGRTLVDGPDDVAAADAVQQQYSLSYYPAPPTQPFPPVPITGSPQTIPDSGLEFYSELNNNLITNPPPADQADLLQTFAMIGVGAGLTPTIDQATAEQAIAIGESLIAQTISQVSVNVNNWLVNYSIGDYGDNYLLRAATAKFGLGANTAEESLYFNAFKDVQGNALVGNKSYRLSFKAGELPPVSPLGFWSLTLYDANGFLVENPIDRYSIGNRTSGLRYNPDGSLDIYIQDQPPIGWESNWLPAPTDSFNLTLRTYLPQDALLDQSYKLRGIQAVSEPSTILGLFAILGFSFLGQRENNTSQNQKDSD
ncbi:DUF1254 domain-containing protein [Aphanothece hegewaldii CCALA 016]|uniref:DUF1254 domain-containing protein n=1 Tax=Aphanothece hegewaldii CCALA 016 TaxID=2107694 RepID=A0A2T1M197_9CHRO|nr:DUF1254 domain-containing protein [Aphanothece hegewaldii]PSF38460.1 DUF1254 domain-containing protein [Aphanothece hegewaldii CCALA 016]